MIKINTIVKHKNGYEGRFYGKSSLSIFYKGKEVLHTGSRNIETEELYEILDGMPEFMSKLIFIVNEEDEEGEI